MDLSPLALDVLENIESTPGAISKSPTAQGLLLSTCNRFDSDKIDGPAIYAKVRDLIGAADHEVELAFYHWEAGSDAANLIGDGLIAAQARRTPGQPLIARFIVDSLGGTINELQSSRLNWIAGGLDTHRVELQFATSERFAPFDANLHDKYVIADARYLLVTGANVEFVHNASPAPPWHDTAYVVEGDAARSALSAFEQVWDRFPDNYAGTYFWDCGPATCLSRSQFPDPPRGWLSGEPAIVGNVPVLAVGKKHDSGGLDPPNETNNPQDIAWLTVMDGARFYIDIESPNLNDDAFRGAVTRAVGRGVMVRLIAAEGFNDTGADLLGGDNQEVVGDLREDIRALYPSQVEKFQVRWYSRNGRDIINGNDPGSGANHTKYMTVDGQLAIVGSGNQETPAWNVSHEFNILIDDPSTVLQLQNDVFNRDWSSAIGRYAEMYEGNGGTQDMICPIGMPAGVARTERLDGDPCSNDETRSLLLHDVVAGQSLRLYDDPDGAYQDDDWTEIRVKRNLTRKYIDTYEASFEDADVRVIAHRDNGLDGKVSFAEVATGPVGPVVDLHEGNGGTQNLVCSRRVTGLATYDFTQDAYCNNDEARSMTLYDFPSDKVVFLYDSPGGNTEDDWTVVVPKRDISALTVASFDTEVSNADISVYAFRNNGLDGKVSRMRIGSPSEIVPLASFYEGNWGQQNKTCDLSIFSRSVNFQSNPYGCDNDEARSMIVSFAKAGTVIDVFDDPGCGTGDDWTRIAVKRDLGRKLIGTFQSSFSDADVDVTFHNDNGLDGKVSCVRMTVP